MDNYCKTTICEHGGKKPVKIQVRICMQRTLLTGYATERVGAHTSLWFRRNKTWSPKGLTPRIHSSLFVSQGPFIPN